MEPPKVAIEVEGDAGLILPTLFTAVVDHALGETRSTPAPALATLKIARAWQTQGDKGVRIEGHDASGVWTIPEFIPFARPKGYLLRRRD